jgi:hypothetical protein
VCVTTPSACAWVARLGFGWSACDSVALFRLGFPSASGELSLNLATYSLLVGPFYKKYAVTFRLRLLIGTKFQDLFHSPSGVLLTFPSRYLFTIDLIHYLVLESGLPWFTPAFTWPMLLKIVRNNWQSIWGTGLSPSPVHLPRWFSYTLFHVGASYGPYIRLATLACATLYGLHTRSLDWSRFARHYSGNLIRFLFLAY